MFGAIDINGESIVPPIYTQISEIQNGLAIIVKDNLYGYINDKGDTVISIEIAFEEEVLNWGRFNENGVARVMRKQSLV